jgi:hypothetical protein
MVRTAIALSTLVLTAGLAHAAIPGTGRIVAGHDANMLSTYTAREQEARMAVNIAQFITQKSTGGTLLMIEPSTTSVLHDYSAGVEAALVAAGFTIAVTQDTSWDAERLSGFDGIFVGTIFDEPYRTLSTGALNSFVQSGKGVYMFSGMGPDRVSEAAALNQFLSPHGLTFDDSEGPGRGGYNGVYETAINSEHELFAGVTSLRSANGMNVLWNEGNMDASLVQVDEFRNGLFGVVENVPVPTPGALALAALGGTLLTRRKRH